MNNSIDDLSDETARRRIFRGVHRAPQSVDDPLDSPRPERDERPIPATDTLDDPYGGFVSADDHKTDGDDFVRPADDFDEDADPYLDPASRRRPSEGLDLLATDPFSPDADRNDVSSASSANLDTFLSLSAHQAASAGLNPAAVRSAPLVPLPNVQDDLRGPSRIFGSQTSVPDLTDTSAGDAMPGGASLQPARQDRLPVPEIGSRPVYRSPEETGGFPGTSRLDLAAPFLSDRKGGAIPETYRAAEVGRTDRADRASGLAGGPAWQPASAQSPPDVRSPEPSFILSYDIGTRDPASEGLPRDLNSAHVESEPADRGRDPAIGHPDERAGTERRDLDSLVRKPETPDPASAQVMPPLGDVSDPRVEPPRSDASDDEPASSRDVRASDHLSKPKLMWTACAAAIAPIVTIFALLYTQPDLLKRLEDLASRPRPASAPRVSTESEAAINLGSAAPAPPAAPAASPTSSPPAETQLAGEAPPPSPEIEAQLKGSDVGVPRLANYPPPILTATPSASGLGRETGASPAPTTEVAPGVDTTPPRGPDSPPLPTSAPSDGKAASGESTRSAATLALETAPTRPSPDAGAPISRTRRSPARHNRTGATASDDALSVKADRLLAAGDILAARTLFQSLVTVGDPRGARGVAQTFDSQVLDRFPASGIVPDQDEAARWRAIAARLETRQRRNQGEAPQ